MIVHQVEQFKTKFMNSTIFGILNRFLNFISNGQIYKFDVKKNSNIFNINTNEMPTKT